MKRIYCDFCNKEIDTSEEAWLKNIIKTAKDPSMADNLLKAQRVCENNDVCADCAREVADFTDALEISSTINKEQYKENPELYEELKSLFLIETLIELYLANWIERQEKKDWMALIAIKRKSFDFTLKFQEYVQMMKEAEEKLK